MELIRRLRTALGERYRIEEALGRGGMITICRSEDLKHRRTVAVKMLDPEPAADPVRSATYR